jgi:NADPH-dependent glutamate synthase beta subunit-like oxidoreductase/Pyruvate/2-oxoacid:ferredoxin oxidoreductase delta subunit
MEAINQESVVAPGDIREAPISLTTTDTNLTGSWKFFRPVLQDRLPPCRNACPLGNDIPGLMQAALDQDLDRALHLLRRHNPLPAVTGRVCPNFCQQECRRGRHDQEVLVGCVERFVGDFGLDRPFPRPHKQRPENVAIVGSGPAGLCAASFLATAGMQVTIFEREPEPGGLLRYGIPAYRLPKDILHREITNLINSLNITLRLNHPVHENDLPALGQQFDRIFCAPGLWSSVRPPDLPISPLILDGLDLLRRINRGDDIDAGSFAVIGGGNVAVDVARSLVRLGKKVDIIYRRTFEQMPAYLDEKTQALEEGVGLHEQQLVSCVDQENGQLRLNLAKAEQQNKKICAGLHTGYMHTDRLIVAIGQAAHMQIPDTDTIVTGGDLVLGPSTVVQAMATGRQGAKKILQGIDPSLAEQIVPDMPHLPVTLPPQAHFDYIAREEPIRRRPKEVSQRCSDFCEVDPGLSAQEAELAAARCLQCGQCTGCGICWFFCPDVAISLDPDAQPKVHIDMEHCKGCGLCATVCPRGIIEMEEDV